MERIVSYRVFACLAECKSFTGTAARLGLSKAMVSSAIRGLEAQLRARLFNRTTRSVRLSQDGSAFFERCVSLLADIDELDGVFREGTSVLSGRLRIDLPTRVASNLIIPGLPDFLAAHPAVQLELSWTDRFVDVVSEGFDCVLRVGSLKDSTLITRPIGQFAVLNVVSPCYIKRFGKPKSQADLAVHWLVHYVNPKTYDSDIDEAKVTVALTQFEQVWAQIFPAAYS